MILLCMNSSMSIGISVIDNSVLLVIVKVLVKVSGLNR